MPTFYIYNNLYIMLQFQVLEKINIVKLNLNQNKFENYYE